MHAHDFIDHYIQVFNTDSSRFAQFFHCPLFNQDAQDREVNAVDSENDENLKRESQQSAYTVNTTL